MTEIWTPIDLGAMRLPHRMAMAPMTRGRAHPDGTPSALAIDYYAQRAGLGLLITEGTQPSEDGQGYLNTPGLHTPAHVEGWRPIASAVHDGRWAHLRAADACRPHVPPGQHPSRRQPVAPSAIAPGVPMFTASGMVPIPEPAR
jgi:2,4-dienoyl-CoA reductase-like NADH-dependent reductase (Old Yellow Enzyme family)